MANSSAQGPSSPSRRKRPSNAKVNAANSSPLPLPTLTSVPLNPFSPRLEISFGAMMMVNRLARLENRFICLLFRGEPTGSWTHGGCHQVPTGLDTPFDLFGVVYYQLQAFQIEDIKQDYDTGKDDVTLITFKVERDRTESLENAIKAICSRDCILQALKQIK